MDREKDSGNRSDVTKVTEPELEPGVHPGPGVLSHHPQLTLEDNNIEAGDSGGGGGGPVMTVVLLLTEVLIVVQVTWEVGGRCCCRWARGGTKSDGGIPGTVVVVAGLQAPPQQHLYPLPQLSCPPHLLFP